MSSIVRKSQKGSALVAVLFVTAIFFVITMILLFQTLSQRIVAANEYDHLAALAHAEAGLSWAEARIYEGTDITDLLLGPDNANAVDDNLFGLRDLSLTSTAQFNNGNEATASAIVQRDFDGQGLKTWEVFRIDDGTDARALVYARLDDNYDDDPDDPANNDPLLDKDRGLQVTVVSEYPVFVDGNGVEKTVAVDRGRARRTLVAEFASEPDFALASNEDINMVGGEVCGECGSMRSNQDLTFSSGTTVCQNATAVGTITGDTGGIGDIEPGSPSMTLPVINPYDDLYVPSIEVFDTLTDNSLPPGLRCRATTADTGASKYFALVAGSGAKGEVWKAYWDFGASRWTWQMIDDLNDNTDVVIDDCGRPSFDPRFGRNDSGPVADGGKTVFYGFKGSKLLWQACTSCPSPGSDTSLCGLADNNFNATGYYPEGGGGLVASPALPGNFQPDVNPDPDFPAAARPKSGWTYSIADVYSPLHGAVIWVLGNMTLLGSAGDTSVGGFQFICSATAGGGCNGATLPLGSWPVSFITLGDMDIQGTANISPARPTAGYVYIAVAGRDLDIGGSAQVDTPGCSGSCSSAAPADIETISGAYGAHEQLTLGGNANIFGLMVAEEALDCSNNVTAPTKVNGNPEIFYDCAHPPNPWAVPPKRVAWQEVE
jgi:Tfp pilus assembly protein PilX